MTKKVCLICAAVVIAWVGGLLALYLGQEWLAPTWVAMLMAASLGALAQKYGSNLGLAGKTVIVMLGLPAIYYLTALRPTTGLGLLTILALIVYWLDRRPNQPGQNGQSKNLTKNNIFKDCC
jgi:hypothetical protein